MTMNRVIIIGGGAAGMLAGIVAARAGSEVTLLEKNEKLGKKLYITGKGRCNVTNACDMEELFQSIRSNEKFLYSAFYSFTNEQTMEFFEELGVKLKVERGNRVFPVSDKSSDVISALQRELKRLGVSCYFNCEAKKLLIENAMVQGVLVQENGREQELSADRVIVATGGLSYPSTGSTGDGFRLAEEVGHTVSECSPALVPIEICENFYKDLQGLSLKNVALKIRCGKKTVYEEQGEMLFTHFGVSGPLVLTGSSYLAPYLLKKQKAVLHLDLKPALSEEQLDERLLRDFSKFANKQYRNSLDELLPRKLIPVIITLSGIAPEKKVNLITKEERKRLVSLIKDMEMEVKGFREYKEAIITRGGIRVKEITPSTMESKLIQGLYFAGEVLDLDAVTGGFNLQIAWSTGYAAGVAAAEG
nr:NAD(P)/FAD-dependent oxidoreductase [Acetivibrio ethanolgignens]